MSMLKLNILKEPINQSWSIMRIAFEAPPPYWEAPFIEAREEFIEITRRLEEQEQKYGRYYPNKVDIFAAFYHTPLPKVKVVILGQDPYHQTVDINNSSMPRAMGLSFSVRPGDSIPSSLMNIYRELIDTVRGFQAPDHGDLRDWARQGVLLLNTCLTVQPGKAGSHGDIWLGFITKIFKAIATVNPHCIYVLWGQHAQKLKPMIGEKSIIFEAAHPSGFSAKKGFFKCNHFNLINDALIKQGKVGINWRIKSSSEPTEVPTKCDIAPKPNLVPVNVQNIYPALLNRPPAEPQHPLMINFNPKTMGFSQSPPRPSPLLPNIPNTKKISPTMIVEIKNGIVNNTTPEISNTSSDLDNTSQIPVIPTINFNISTSNSTSTSILPQIDSII